MEVIVTSILTHEALYMLVLLLLCISAFYIRRRIIYRKKINEEKETMIEDFEEEIELDEWEDTEEPEKIWKSFEEDWKKNGNKEVSEDDFKP